MTNVISGQVTVNNQDLWDDFHAFLREEKKGGRENLNALLAPARTKDHVAVNLREQNGENTQQSWIRRARAGMSPCISPSTPLPVHSSSHATGRSSHS